MKGLTDHWHTNPSFSSGKLKYHINMSSATVLALSLLVQTFVVCKQFGPRSGQQHYVGPDLGSNCLTL